MRDEDYWILAYCNSYSQLTVPSKLVEHCRYNPIIPCDDDQWTESSDVKDDGFADSSDYDYEEEPVRREKRG